MTERQKPPRKAAGRRRAADQGRLDAANAAASPLASCACALPHHPGNPDRRAVAVDPDIRTRNVKRLRRIEGQIRGLQKMVDGDRYCADILVQISSVQEALRGVARELMRNHLKHCATSAIRAGAEQADAMYDELTELMFRYGR